MISVKCKVCGKSARLEDAGPGPKSPKYERAYKCPEGHVTTLSNGDEKDEEAAEPSGKPYYESVFADVEKRRTAPKDGLDADGQRMPGDKSAELCALQRLNKFLDELEGKADA